MASLHPLAVLRTTAATFRDRRPRRCGRSAGRPSAASACIRSRRVGPQAAQPRQIVGQLRGDAHVLLGVGGDQLRQAKIRQLAQAGPPHDRRPHQGHDRHAHPERIQAGGVAVVGERYPGRCRCRGNTASTAAAAVGDEGHAIGGRRLPRPASPARCRRCDPRRPAASAASIDGLEDPRPELQHRRVDLAEIVQAAKGDIALRPRPAGR